MKISNFIKLLAFTVATSFLFSLTACDDGLGLFDNKTIKGKGEYQRFTREAKDFKGIELSMAATVHLKQGAAYKVVIEGQQNIVDVIETNVNNGVLEIETKSGVWNLNYDRLDIYIETPNVNSLDVSSAGNMLIETVLTTDKLDISVSGSGNIESQQSITAQSMDMGVSGSGNINIGAIAVGSIEASVSGSGEIEMKGTAEKADFGVSGSGNINAMGVVAKAVKAHSSGSGNISCTANESLDASASGSGDVSYTGTATKVSTSASGSGEVSRKN